MIIAACLAACGISFYLGHRQGTSWGCATMLSVSMAHNNRLMGLMTSEEQQKYLELTLVAIAAAERERGRE